MTTKERLHQRVDAIPNEGLQAARQALERLVDPFLLALAIAPIDDEPSTPKEDAGAEEAWQEYLRGEARPWEEVRRELAGGE
jgi:hypothetical protein